MGPELASVGASAAAAGFIDSSFLRNGSCLRDANDPRQRKARIRLSSNVGSSQSRAKSGQPSEREKSTAQPPTTRILMPARNVVGTSFPQSGSVPRTPLTPLREAWHRF